MLECLTAESQNHTRVTGCCACLYGDALFALTLLVGRQEGHQA